jgi:hypothetical protein
MAIEMLKFFSGQDDLYTRGGALQDSREFTGKCNEDVVRGVVTVEEKEGNSE